MTGLKLKQKRPSARHQRRRLLVDLKLRRRRPPNCWGPCQILERKSSAYSMKLDVVLIMISLRLVPTT